MNSSWQRGYVFFADWLSTESSRLSFRYRCNIQVKERWYEPIKRILNVRVVFISVITLSLSKLMTQSAFVFIKKNKNKTQAEFQFPSLYSNARLSIIPTRFDISYIVSRTDKYILTRRQSYLNTDNSWHNVTMNKNESCKLACVL